VELELGNEVVIVARLLRLQLGGQTAGHSAEVKLVKSEWIMSNRQE